MAAGLFNPGASTRAIAAIEYSVAATGDTFFQPTIGTEDSPDYTDDNTTALAQCKVLSPLGKERVA
jgi:hypothetical protein